ncbi:MAG: hypothetical protein O7A08_11565 [SAR324 cluster bacterium]|nr:hypothetical protein [SAR324 cluster bacterium]
MPIKPKRKASKLIKQLNLLLHQESRDEVSLRKFKKDVESLRSSDAFSAYILLGGLASKEQDVEGMRENHSKALKIRPKYPDANINYANSLKHLGFYTEAREHAQRALLADHTHLPTLNDLIEMCLFSGRIREAKKWLRNLRRIKHEKANESRKLILRASELLDECGVSDDDVERLLQLKMSVLHKQKVYPARTIADTFEDEESAWLNFFVEVNVSPAKAVELNFKAAGELAVSDIPPYVTDSVVATFTSVVS